MEVEHLSGITHLGGYSFRVQTNLYPMFSLNFIFLAFSFSLSFSFSRKIWVGGGLNDFYL